MDRAIVCTELFALIPTDFVDRCVDVSPLIDEALELV